MARKKTRISPYARGRSFEQIKADTLAHQARQAAEREAERAQFEQRRAERQARIEAEESAQAEKERAQRESLLRRTSLAAWLADGGTEADFNTAWPSLFADILRQKAVERAASGLGDELDQAVRAVATL